MPNANYILDQISALLKSHATAEDAFSPGKSSIPASGKLVGNEEKLLMIEAVLDGWLTAGRFNDAFEKQLAEFLRCPHVLTVNSGSSANLVALSTLTSPLLRERRIQQGDEVITVAAGFPTTIAPILQIGAIPVFVDVDCQTWNAPLEAIEKAISPKTKAVILAHTLGIPYDAPGMRKLCDAHGLWLVEDCCDALGTLWDNKQVGSFGHINTLSFYPAHHITTGEGGAVFCSDPLLAKIAESFRDWGRHCHCRPGQDNACGRRFEGKYGDLPESYDHKYVYAHAGYNLKMTDMTASCGIAQMQKLPHFIESRKRNYAILHAHLAACPLLKLPILPPQADPSWFGFPIILQQDAPLKRVDILRKLNDYKIGTRLLFAGNAVRQPFMQDKQYRCAEALTGTDTLMERGFWIGLWPGLTKEMLDYSASMLLQILEGNI